MVSLPPGPEDLVNAHSNPGHTLPLTLMGLVESDRTGVLSVSQALTFDTSMYPKKACAVVYMPHAHRSKWGPFRVLCRVGKDKAFWNCPKQPVRLGLFGPLLQEMRHHLSFFILWKDRELG